MKLSKANMTRIETGIQSQEKAILEIGRFLHRNPELGFAEVQAAHRITTYLQSLGFKVEKPYGGLKTAFRAVLTGNGRGPKIAVLAEYDALAGLGHGCGHNLITVTALAAAAGIRGCGRQFPGQFEIIGTPAEEMYAGKCDMVKAGAFHHLDACFMAHPAGANSIGAGSIACRSLTAQFHGKAAHASVCPEEGINALDAAILFFNNVNALRQHLREESRIHGIIKKGGDSSNIVPELTEVEMTARSRDEAYWKILQKRVETACRAAAKAVGARVTIKWDRYYYRTFKVNPELDDVLVDSFSAAGIRLPKQSGPLGMGSLDTANISQILPAAHPFFDITPPGFKGKVVIHSQEFVRLSDTPTAYRKALAAGAGMAMAALRLLKDPPSLSRIRRA